MSTLHIVSHTHWDREWYRTFQDFRFRLVHLVDQVLDLLENDPDYPYFTLDGQTIMLDDYLAIRPEQEPRIRNLIQAGRLLVGPWYVLPDEFLEGPEAMLRNLQFGAAGCRRFTAERQSMESICYVPDSFGHISQLPQIAAGYSMEALCVWRGVGDAPDAFRWAAPDGTERLMLHLRDSYSNGAWLADDEEGFVHDLGVERDTLLPHATTSHLLVMYGTDHRLPRPDLPARLAAAERGMGVSVTQSTLPGFLSEAKAELGPQGLAGLPLRQGELRSPERAHLLPAVLSARVWIKQRNSRCETLLTRWAEPFSALAEQFPGTPSQRGFLRSAWDWLLQNHPHDSICGCSIDQVHREMSTRFDWSEQLAEAVTQSSLDALAEQIDTVGAGSSGEHSTSVIVFNPIPQVRTDRVRVHVDAAGDWTVLDQDGQPVPCSAVCRCEHEHMNELMDRDRFTAFLSQLVSGKGPNAGQFSFLRFDAQAERNTAHLEVAISTRPSPRQPEVSAEQATLLQGLMANEEIEAFHLHVVQDAGADLEFLARDVPGVGYAQFALTGAPAAGRTPPAVDPQAPLTPALERSEGIGNEFFSVSADPVDGTLTVTDRRTGLVLSGMNHFVDSGDRGDEYTFCPPEHDAQVDRPAAPPTIQRLEDALGQCLEIGLVYRVPCGLAPGDRSSRSQELVDLIITSRVTLTSGVQRVDFETTVHNSARDHRLRAHFPTQIVTDSSWGEGHFDVIQRPIALPAGTEEWAEQPIGTNPQLTFVDVTDGQRGVMLINQGLPEYEALPGTGVSPGVTLALTLLRCVGWLSRGDLHTRSGHAGPPLETPEAQSPGAHTFRYALAPHTGNYLTVQHEAHAFNAPLRAVCTGAHAGSLPPAARLVEVSPSAAILTACKPSDQGERMILRVFNSAPVAVQARIKLWRAFQEAVQVQLDERTSVGSEAEKSDTIILPLRTREIATVRLQF